MNLNDYKTPEQLIEQEYDKIIVNFRYTFGNDNHIKVVKLHKEITDINEEITKLKDKEVIKKRLQNIGQIKRKIVYLIKHI